MPEPAPGRNARPNGGDGATAIRGPARRERRSIARDLEDGVGECLRRLLWQVVPDASCDDPVRILPRELLGIRTGIGMRRTVGITLEGDGGHRDDRTRREAPFEIVVLRLAFGEPEPPAVVMNPDADMSRIDEGRSAASERGIVEVPLR